MLSKSKYTFEDLEVENWMGPNYKPTPNLFEKADGISLLVGPDNKIVAIEIKDWKTNIKWSELALDISGNMHVLFGNDMYLIYKYQPRLSTLRIPEDYRYIHGVNFMFGVGRIPFYGLQENGSYIRDENIINYMALHDMKDEVYEKIAKEFN